MTVCEIENVGETEQLWQGEKRDTHKNDDRFIPFSPITKHSHMMHGRVIWPDFITLLILQKEAKMTLTLITRSVSS